MDTLEPDAFDLKLTAWQRKQAAMLYHFSSADYLRGLHQMVTDLINGLIDPLLDVAKAQNRDRVLLDKVWGDRNTSENWANYAWPFLKDLQASLAKGIVLRSSNHFCVTSVNECFRGLEEYSMEWMTPGEERMLELALGTISDYAAQLDRTVTEHENRWNDYRFAYNYPAFAALHPQVPKVAIRSDVGGDTGRVPPQTGVYVCVDHPHAALQFAWVENGGTELRMATTFNEIGLAALAAVGRQALWFDEGKMFNFATSPPYAANFRDSVFLDGEPYPSLAPAAVARTAFTTCPGKWLLVEMLPGQFEGLANLTETDVSTGLVARRIAGGERCVHAGYYFTPSSQNSRRFFEQDETAPILDSHYGITYWQWDLNQE